MPRVKAESGVKDVGEDAFSFAADVFKTFASGDGGWLSGAAQAWSSETRRQMEEMSTHNMRTLQQLADCKTPLDILRVEQEWMTERSKAMFEGGVRMAKLFADATQTMAQLPAAGGRR